MNLPGVVLAVLLGFLAGCAGLWRLVRKLGEEELPEEPSEAVSVQETTDAPERRCRAARVRGYAMTPLRRW